MRYCEKCATIKPDRAHHCSVCGTCVLKVALLYFERNASLSFSDGSPLSMGEQLRGIQQLQVFCTLPPLRTPLLPLCCPNQFEVLSSGENRDNNQDSIFIPSHVAVLERCGNRSRSRPVSHSFPLLCLLHVLHLPLLPPRLSHTPCSQQSNYTRSIQVIRILSYDTAPVRRQRQCC